MKRKMILFTHTDLDGIGCSVLANLVSIHPHKIFDELSVRYEQPSSINNALIKFIDEELPGIKPKAGDKLDIYVTDLGPSTKVLHQLYRKVDSINLDSTFGNITIRVLDHHVTSADINQFAFAVSSVYDEEFFGQQLTCGTKLLYRDFVKNGFFNKCDKSTLYPKKEVIEKFVNQVRLYDTFEWQKRNSVEAYILNLHHIYTPTSQFIADIIQRMMSMDSSDESILEPTLHERYMLRYYNTLDMANDVCDHYDELLKVSVPNPDYHYFTTGSSHYSGIALFNQSNNSLVSNVVAERLKDKIDFVANIVIRSYGTSTITLISVKDGVDVSKLAKMNGGGGHEHAAGFSINDEAIELLHSTVREHVFTV